MTVTKRTPVRAQANMAPDLEAMSADLPQPVRQPVREADLKPGEFLGRNGEVLSIKRRPDQNIFEIPTHLMDQNFTYEWKRFATYGKPDVTYQVQLAENGWRPVMVEPGSPFAGYYMPENYRGPVEREDLMLMERPIGLTKLVRAEERNRASGQLQLNHKRYTERRGVETPQGFTTANPNVPASIGTSYDQGPAPAKGSMPID